MKIGDLVKVITKDYPRYGEVGKIVGKEMTPFGVCFRVEFGDEVGLYQLKHLKKV